MEPGSIVEFIDRQKIMCAVVLDVKKLRLRLLTENNREINISANRLSHHKGDVRLDLTVSRDKLIEALKETAFRRKALTDDVNIRELWEVLNNEAEWIDLPTMTEFCFPEAPTRDHEAAVIRAFFNDRKYFKFNTDRFYPNSEEQVERLNAQAAAAERRERLIDKGVICLRNALNERNTEADLELTDIFKSYYLFDNESPHADMAKAILEKAGYKTNEAFFRALVNLGEWDEDENLDFHRYEIPRAFPEAVLETADRAVRAHPDFAAEPGRRDLTALPLITIDGQATLDFDDALSLQEADGHYVIGIHVADVAHYVKKDDAVDREAMYRGSSIYMPDQKISMLPTRLSEDFCSLKAGAGRPAISVMARVRPDAQIVDVEIIPSIVRVKHQLTYHDVNLMAGQDRVVDVLYDVAMRFQQRRLDQGATQITLPEVNIWIDPNGDLIYTQTNRESPGRLLVAELMIMANWLTARFLSERGLAAVFRSQSEPRERLYPNNEGTLFQNWMQRKLLSRFVLGTEPERHCGLGLDVYTTASSPIRKYSDLVAQRQIRAAFGLETPYRHEEIQQIIHALEQPMAQVGRVQFQRHRYWLLKYLEGKAGDRTEAIVLAKRKSNYIVLLADYMIECTLPVSFGIELKPETIVQVTIQHVDARKDILNVFLS